MACYHKLYKSHSWLWAQQTQAIDSHYFHMQLLTTTFLFTIIHEDRRPHQWKQTETMVALASLALQSDKKLFQKGNLENKCVILTLSGADVHARSVSIDPYKYWGLYWFFPGHFLRQWNLTSVHSGSDGGSLWRLLYSLVHPKTQHLKSLFGADSVYLQQLQQVISNGGGGPQLLTVSVLIGQRHKWAGLFPLSDVHRGRIWNCLFWETVYNFFRL